MIKSINLQLPLTIKIFKSRCKSGQKFCNQTKRVF